MLNIFCCGYEMSHVILYNVHYDWIIYVIHTVMSCFYGVIYTHVEYSRDWRVIKKVAIV